MNVRALVEPRHHVIPYAGKRLHAIEWPAAVPDAPTIFCQHYAWTTADVWADLPADLGYRYRVIALDSPGHGDSDLIEPDDPSAICKTVVDHLVGGPAIFIGASNGARRTLFYALEHPEWVAKLVLVEWPVLAGDHTREKEKARIGRLPPAPGSFEALVEAWRKYIYPHADPEALILYLQRTHHVVDGAWKLRGTMEEHGLSVFRIDATLENVWRLKMPVLVVYADKSRICGESGGRMIQERIAGSRLVGIERCGHLVHLNQTGRLHKLIAEFCVG